MHIEVEFKWPLACGVTVIVAAIGSYYDDGVHFVNLGFITENDTESRNYRTFEGIASEYRQMEDHAALMIQDRAREQITEVECVG